MAPLINGSLGASFTHSRAWSGEPGMIPLFFDLALDSSNIFLNYQSIYWIQYTHREKASMASSHAYVQYPIHFHSIILEKKTEK